MEQVSILRLYDDVQIAAILLIFVIGTYAVAAASTTVSAVSCVAIVVVSINVKGFNCILLNY